MKRFLSIDVDRKRVFGLDLLRAFAIFCVVQGHGERLLYDTVLDRFTDLPLPHGVDIFFIMSGFLIGKSFLSYLERNDNHLGRKKILTFYARTALRILPNYLFILLVNYLLVRFQIIPGNLKAFPMWRFATFTQNLVTPFWDFYWESWSLPVQWWFYIFFPLFLVLLTRLTNPKQFVPWLCLFFVVLSIGFRLSISEEVTDFFRWDIWIRKTVASRCDNIYIGVMAAWVKHYYPKQWDRYALVSLLVGLVLFVALRFVPRNLGTVYYNGFYLTLSALAIVFWLPVFTKWKSYKTVVGGFVSRISILSYAMFLTNSITVLTMDKVCPQLIKNHGVVSYFVYWMLVLIFSYLLHILIEKPFVKIRERL